VTVNVQEAGLPKTRRNRQHLTLIRLKSVCGHHASVCGQRAVLLRLFTLPARRVLALCQVLDALQECRAVPAGRRPRNMSPHE